MRESEGGGEGKEEESEEEEAGHGGGGSMGRGKVWERGTFVGLGTLGLREP